MYTTPLLFVLLACGYCLAENVDPVPILQLLSTPHAAFITKRQVGRPTSVDSDQTSNPDSLESVVNNTLKPDTTETTRSELEIILDEILGNRNSRTSTKAPAASNSLPTAASDAANSADGGHLSCTRPDGESGVCVNYFLCVEDAASVIYGTKFFNNSADECPSSIHICCLMSDKRAA